MPKKGQPSRYFRKDWKWWVRRSYINRTIKPEDISDIMDQLKFYRHRAGLSMRQMADKIGYHYQSVMKWESKDNLIRWEAVEKWCHILKLRIMIIPGENFFDSLVDTGHQKSTLQRKINERVEAQDFYSKALSLKPSCRTMIDTFSVMRKYYKYPRKHMAEYLGIEDERLKGMESGKFYWNYPFVEGYLEKLGYRMVIIPSPDEDLVVTKHWKEWNSKGRKK